MIEKRVKKQERDLLVSRKYYERLRENVREIVEDAGLRERHFEEIMYLVDRQVGLTPAWQDEDKFLRFSFVVFFTLRIEINRAVVRSMAARERARVRAARRATEELLTASDKGDDEDDASLRPSCHGSHGAEMRQSGQDSRGSEMRQSSQDPRRSGMRQSPQSGRPYGYGFTIVTIISDAPRPLSTLHDLYRALPAVGRG